MPSHEMKMDFTTLAITRVVKSTAAAVLVKLTNQHDEMEIWIPRSNLSYRSDKAIDKSFDQSELSVADWFLKEKGL